MNEPKLAEICGLHAGDGYLRNDGKRVELDISGSVEEKDFYDCHVIPLFSKFFAIKIAGKLFPHRNTYGFVIRDKEVVKFIHTLGFPYGGKTFIVRAPKLVFKSQKNMKRFLRGVFDTDGCLYFEKKQKKIHYYPRIILSTCSKNLCDDICRILKYLEIKYWLQQQKSKNPRESLKYKIWIRITSEVEKWFKSIGSKNGSKMSRYLIWKKYGFCPSNLTYEQRKQILIGDKHPINFYGPVA